MDDRVGETGTPLRNSLWNLLYRIVSASDHSRTAWGTILRGTCLAFFKEPIDELPLADGDAARRVFREHFFGLAEHRVYDLYEFLLVNEGAGMKEVDRKLVRRAVNRILEEEGAPVRLLRDRFVPLPDDLGLDAVAAAGECLTLFDMAAASRHLESAVAFLSRRPEPSTGEAVREALIAVAAAVRTLGNGSGNVAMGTVAPVAERLGIRGRLREGIEAVLAHCHSASGLPGGGTREVAPDLAEATFLIVCCSGVINLLLSRVETTRRG